MTKAKPETVNILGVTYKIDYMANSSEVDIHKRASLWGQIDFWTRTIRIYDNGRSDADVWQTLLHEILHGICESMHIKLEDDEKTTDLLATGLADVFFRNGWIQIE